MIEILLGQMKTSLRKMQNVYDYLVLNEADNAKLDIIGEEIGELFCTIAEIENELEVQKLEAQIESD